MDETQNIFRFGAAISVTITAVAAAVIRRRRQRVIIQRQSPYVWERTRMRDFWERIVNEEFTDELWIQNFRKIQIQFKTSEISPSPPPSTYTVPSTLEMNWSLDPLRHVRWQRIARKVFPLHFCDILLYRHFWKTTSWERKNFLAIFGRFFEM